MSNKLSLLYNKIEQDTNRLNNLSRFRLQKLNNIAKKVFAEYSLLFNKNRLLFIQNNKKVSRKSIRLTIVSITKVMNYEDIIDTQMNYNIKTARRISKLKKSVPTSQDIEKAEEEIRSLELVNYYLVLYFN